MNPRSKTFVATFLGLTASLPGCTRDAVPQGSPPLLPASASMAEAPAPPAVNHASERLDCEWVRKKDNCWQTMKREIRACLGPLPIEGMLARDGKICTASNAEVLFRPETPKAPTWVLDIEVRVANKTCFRYRDTGPETGTRTDTPRVHVLEGPTGATISFTSGMPPTLVCPDGSTFRAGPADLGLEGCTTERVWEGALPLGVGNFHPDTSPIWLSLDPRWGHVFDCERPRD
ncbi:hypothetical protein [Polyangium jinanense]|uniref:Uncharacterized protein n=1 Tax=Polyangium jinanense TaxID=2829994 RepID=A0A9X4AY61_9BACT|nr:hypothetical protein [Polyangium jinanense]MDC3961801.1 hypothetical protein [Polyangium jinanense]MDC3989333.1 hypothetical protein [Polyangium jinanense]